MSDDLYRASYQLESMEVIQTLYLSPEGDKSEVLQWLAATLSELTQKVSFPLVGVTIRLNSLAAVTKVGVFVNVENQHVNALAQMEKSQIVVGQTIASFAVKNIALFDEYCLLSDDMVVQRLSNTHHFSDSFSLLSNFSLFDFISVLFSHTFDADCPIALQFNFEPISQPDEIQRNAKKWIIKLDFESGIPRKAKTLLKQSIQASNDAQWWADNLIAFHTDQAEYVKQLINDIYYQSIAPLGFDDYPLVNDDIAEDLLHSCLPWSALESFSAETSVSRRQHFSQFTAAIQSTLKDLASGLHLSQDSKLDGTFDVFISYSSRNFNQASAVCHGVEARGIRCWMAPRDISPGESYAAAIMSAIAQCKLFVLVYSDASNASQHVLREVERAVNQNKIIIPFRIEEAEMQSDLAYFISVCHWLDAVTPPLTEHVDSLVDTLKKHLS